MITVYFILILFDLIVCIEKLLMCSILTNKYKTLNFKPLVNSLGNINVPTDVFFEKDEEDYLIYILELTYVSIDENIFEFSHKKYRNNEIMLDRMDEIL